MAIYITMLLISVISLIAASKVQKKWKKITLYVLSVIPFFLVSAFRYDVGTDYLKRYWYDYNRMVQGKNVSNLEIGFKIIIKICIIFSKEPYILFVICSGIIIGLIMYTVITKSRNPILSVLIFFLGGFFFDSLNIMRQYMAMSIVFFAYNFLLEDKKTILYILCVILAGTFHSSAFIMLVLALLPKKEYANWKLVLPVTVIILLLNERLFKILEIALQGTRFNVYFSGKLAKGEVSFLLIAENLLFYLAMNYMYFKNKKIGNIDKQDTLFLNIQTLALLCIAISTCHMLFIRITLFFSIFQIISVPYYISKMPIQEIEKDINKISKGKLKLKKEKFQKYATIIIVLCFIFAFTRTNILTNTNRVLPYRTIFNKELSIK